MKNLQVAFQNRDFSACLAPNHLKFVVNSYGFEAVGGCKEASITVYGGELALEETLNWLRRPVTIYDGRGVAVWWGYVHGVQMRKDALEIAPSLDSMVNRVAVAYSYVEPNTQVVGTRKTTPWADDLDSQAEYGIKELLSSASGLSDAAALARRAAVLKGQAWPYGGLSQFGGPRGAVRYSGAKKSASATLVCRGWWETLGWKYAAVSVVPNLNYYFPSAVSAWGIGNGGTSVRGGQSFTVGSQDLNAKTVTLRVYKVGAPVDNLVVALQANLAGVPSGTDLATATMAGGSLTTSYQTLTFTLSATTKLTAGSLAWIVVRRSGGLDAANYYMWVVESGGSYAGGAAALYDGSAWSIPATYDAYFSVDVDNAIDSTRQISNLVGNFGQFMTAVDLDSTGSELPSYQDGDKSALAVILDLLAVGGPNGRRLLASVDVNRRVQIWEEPAESSAAYSMTSTAQLYGPGGSAVEETRPPVGVWLRLKDVLSGVVDLTKLADPSLQFIESARWSAGSGTSYGFKGKPSIDSLLAIGG